MKVSLTCNCGEDSSINIEITDDGVRFKCDNCGDEDFKSNRFTKKSGEGE